MAPYIILTQISLSERKEHATHAGRSQGALTSGALTGRIFIYIVFNNLTPVYLFFSSAWRAGISSPPGWGGFGSVSRYRSSTLCAVPSTIATLLTPALSDPLTAVTPRSPDSPYGPRGLAQDTATSSSAPSGRHVWRLVC